MAPWDSLDQHLDRAEGDYSLCLCNAAGQRLYGYRADDPWPAASLIKLPLAMACCDLAEQRLLDLEAKLLVPPEARVDGDGALDAGVPPGGLRRSARQLIAHALVESDNTAANMLLDLLGMDALDDWLEQRGYRQTRLRRRFMDFAAMRAGRDNQTSAAEMCRLLQQLQQPRYAALEALLRQAAGADKLAAGLPPGTPIAHKTGDLPAAEHDAGIVYLPSGPLIVAALSAGLPDAPTGKRAIAEAMRLIVRLSES